jgi:L-lactate dehydrogenase complex protein LldF
MAFTPFVKKSIEAIQNEALQKTLNRATTLSLQKRAELVSEEPLWEQYRSYAFNVRAHIFAHLEEYLLKVEKNWIDAGIKVHWCESAEEALNIIYQIAQELNVRYIVKAKSMTTEEINLNRFLQRRGIQARETDLGEYIVQLAVESPSHITAPALHKSVHDIAVLFQKELGISYTTNPENLTMAARKKLRYEFLKADMGISGANFVIAEDGTLVIIENEGNIRFCTTLPDVHLCIVGIDKIIPSWEDLPIFLRLLPVSATGQKITSYVSFIRRSARKGEDGPKEVHVILLDNGRTDILKKPDFFESLYCIRCGVCMSVCPVYQHVGGHAYNFVYPGPIGAVIGPIMNPKGNLSSLPYASSLCGSCGEICPVKIDLPGMILKHRQNIFHSSVKHPVQTWLIKVWTWFMINEKRYRIISNIVRRAQRILFSGRERLPIPVWGRTRTFPLFHEYTFRDWMERNL